MVIHTLTPEHRRVAEATRDAWRDIGLAQGQGNALVAEIALRAATGRNVPVVWCEASDIAAIASGDVSDARLERWLRDAGVSDGLGERQREVTCEVAARLGNYCRDTLASYAWDELANVVFHPLMAAIDRRILAPMIRMLEGRRGWRSSRGSPWGNAAGVWPTLHVSGGGYGCLDAPWLAFFAAAHALSPLPAPLQQELAAHTELAKHAGWWLCFENVCFVTRRPRVSIDERGRLHNENGPAIATDTGRPILYAWHGTEVPDDFIRDKENLPVDRALRWPNLEQRRAAAEILGWARVIRELDSRVIQEDPNPEIGTLLEVRLPDAPAARFLRVRCGTGREFVLSVPPTMQTAREANAWTWGLRPEDYAPQVRT